MADIVWEGEFVEDGWLSVGIGPPAKNFMQWSFEISKASEIKQSSGKKWFWLAVGLSLRRFRAQEEEGNLRKSRRKVRSHIKSDVCASCFVYNRRKFLFGGMRT
jgi:hypothetical protein